MKITLAQQNYIIGDFEYNTQKIIEAVKYALQEGSELIVFPELSVCGYPPRDFLEFKDFIQRCDESIQKISAFSNEIGIIVGAPAPNPDPKGKDLFNSAYYLYKGQIQQVIHKTLLPTYDVFDEVRYFESATELHTIHHKGTKIALTICEDIWNTGDNPLYRRTPLDELMIERPELIINISASPFDYTQQNKREKLLNEICAKYGLPVIYCNTVGAHTELIFDGASLVFDAKGNKVCELKSFAEQILTVDTNSLNPSHNGKPKEKIEWIHDALIFGIREYFSKLGFSRAILGLSGGIDSAVVLVLAAKALGKDNVKPVLLPSTFSSEHSVTDSLELCHRIDVSPFTIPIHNTFESALDSLKPYFKTPEFGIAEENMQARIRALFLMALSNKNGYILLNTSNKSEAAVGYGTLYGDMCGGLSVIGDVYKTQVYELAAFINRRQEIIPFNILTKAPSAELRPNQKDSDSLPPYDLLDAILHLYIEERKGPSEIKALGYDDALVYKVLRLVNTNEYKRHQTPPILRISPKAFGSGRRMPIVGKYLD